MPFEYEALVGHLYVVGGRSISAPPPGSLVEVSPRKAARGREADTIFTLVLPSGDVSAPASFYEQMAALAAERYFDSTGSVTAGLRLVFGHLNENLYNHNTRNPSHYEASMLCAVLRGSDLYLARVGSGVGLLRHNGETQPFPADFGNDEALFGPPLGIYPSPDVKMAMYQVINGTRLVIADVALADVDTSKTTAALALPDIGEVLVALKEMVQTQITLTVIEFVPPEQPTPLPVREVESTGGAVTSTSEVRAAPPPASPAPEAQAPTPREAGKPRLSEARSSNVKRSAGAAALGAGKALAGVNSTLDRVIPLPKEGQRSWLSTPAATGIAVFIPVLVVVVVLIMWLTGTGQSEFDLCVNEANAAAQVARAVASSDVTGTLAAWNGVLVIVDQCNQIRLGDPAMAALTGEARTVIDALLQITRRPTALIESLPSAVLKRGILQGEDLYVLDDGNDVVYRLVLTTEGNGLAAPREPIQAMRRQGTVNQFTIGDIIDIAYTEDGSGVSQGNVITALDRNGVLVDCPPRFLQNCSAQQINTDTWNSPVAMHFWRGRLYLLDPAGNQLWRYDPSGGAYPNTPIEYFVGEGRPDIRSAVDFAIDAEGTVYILTSGGEMLRYISGTREGFDFANFPEQESLTGVSSMFVSTNPVDLMVYFVNPVNRTIFQTTYTGAFVNSYRAENEAQFTQVADVVVDANKRIMYILSGNSVLAIRRG